MNKDTITIIVLIWLAANIILPLVIRSLDRLYKDNIDLLVSKSVSLFNMSAIYTFQLLFLAFFSPAVVMSIILIWFKNKKVEIYSGKENMKKIPHLFFNTKILVLGVFNRNYIVRGGE